MLSTIVHGWQVMDLKPADYRRRIPEDRDADYIRKTIRRLNLFTDPTLRKIMHPVDDRVRRQIYDGVSHDGEGRVKYLIVSHPHTHGRGTQGTITCACRPILILFVMFACLCLFILFLFISVCYRQGE